MMKSPESLGGEPSPSAGFSMQPGKSLFAREIRTDRLFLH